MRAPDPRKCTRDTNGKRKVRDDASNKWPVAVALVIEEDVRDAVNEPEEARRGTPGVDAADVQYEGGAPEAEPERCTLVGQEDQHLDANLCQNNSLLQTC